jgi:hypothetical protein
MRQAIRLIRLIALHEFYYDSKTHFLSWRINEGLGMPPQHIELGICLNPEEPTELLEFIARYGGVITGRDNLGDIAESNETNR